MIRDDSAVKMMTSVLLACVVILCVHGQSVRTGSIGPRERDNSLVPMRKYAVDLDKSPKERWISILSDYKTSVPLIIEYFNNIENKIEKSLLKTLLGDLNTYFGEYGVEMKAIAEYLGIDIGIIVTLNLSYELRRLGGGHINTTGNVSMSTPEYHGGMACTSIVAQNKSGNVFHGRNMDWYIPYSLRNMSIQVDFLKQGKVVFTGDVIVGVVGVFTGISKNGGFSLSINERNLGGNIIMNGLEGLLTHSKCPSHLAREVLTSSVSYTDALQSLKTQQLVAPVYYIAAGSGPNEGAVITRDRNFCRNLWLLDYGQNNQTQDSWYLLETNYDQWKKPQPYDNRREFGLKYMEALGQEKAASAMGLLSVLSMWPIRNNFTSYTTLMSPGGFSIQSYNIYT